MDFIEFVDLEAGIDEYIDLVGASNIRLPKKTALKWAQDVVDKLSFPKSLQHAVAWYQVKDGRVVLDDKLKSVAKMLYRKQPDEPMTRAKVVQWIDYNYKNSGCDLKLDLDCPDGDCGENKIVVDVDDYFRWDNPQLTHDIDRKRMVDYGGLKNLGRPTYVDENFKLLRPRSHEFAALSQMHIKGCENLDEKLRVGDVPEYWVTNFPVMHVSGLRDGDEVLVSYLKYATGESGYLMIPNIPEIFEAIKWKLDENYSYRQYKRTRDSSYRNDADRAYEKFYSAMGRARHRLKAPNLSDYQMLAERVLGSMFGSRIGDLGRYKNDSYNKTMRRLQNP